MADENSSNVNLAEILRKDLGEAVDVDTEIPFKYATDARRVADIVCLDVEGFAIGIEAQRGWRRDKLNANKQASVRQAEELVDTKHYRNFCDAAIALIYPDSYKTLDHLQGRKVKVAIRAPLGIRKKKAPQWKNCAVKDLPAFIARIADAYNRKQKS